MAAPMPMFEPGRSYNFTDYCKPSNLSTLVTSIVERILIFGCNQAIKYLRACIVSIIHRRPPIE